MKAIKKSIKILTFSICITLPLYIFGDGGMPKRECTETIYYDVQPTTLTNLKLELSSLKINGKVVSNINSIQTITPLINNGYRMKRSVMDTLFITNIQISSDNTNIQALDVIAADSFDFSVPFKKK